MMTVDVVVLIKRMTSFYTRNKFRKYDQRLPKKLFNMRTPTNKLPERPRRKT